MNTTNDSHLIITRRLSLGFCNRFWHIRLLQFEYGLFRDSIQHHNNGWVSIITWQTMVFTGRRFRSCILCIICSGSGLRLLLVTKLVTYVINFMRIVLMLCVALECFPVQLASVCVRVRSCELRTLVVWSGGSFCSSRTLCNEVGVKPAAFTHIQTHRHANNTCKRHLPTSSRYTII